MSRSDRLTKGSEYRTTVRTGNRVGSEYLVTYAVFVSRETSARFGYIVTKAIGNAVTRNLMRRRLKSIAQEIKANGFVGCDVVIRLFPKAVELSYQDLKAAVEKAISRQEKSIFGE